MLIISFTLRRMLRYWFLSLLVLIGLSLAAAFLAGLPSYAAAISASSLNQVIENASPAAKHIELIAPRSSLTSALYSDIKDELGDWMLERISLESAGINVSYDSSQVEEPGELKPESLFQIEQAYLWS